jgi:hypothetical protein
MLQRFGIFYLQKCAGPIGSTPQGRGLRPFVTFGSKKK